MSTTLRKVGIVLVSYNASLATRVTLASLRAAYNEVPYEVVLVDNASAPPERDRIERAFEIHREAAGPGWEWLPQDANLGFSGGNNVGIRRFIDRPDITHVCLLNSDVLVPDHWLDRLLAPRAAIISAVTNKADSEQCVPVDYELELADCLDPDTESLTQKAALRVNAFAERRWRAFKGCTVETDVTFFCVLMTREAVRTLGLLDETFFPGGYEDNDYCLRAREAGIPLHLARDCFIHHWGSASFGQLQHEYFSDRARRNARYLEEKHGIVLTRHPEKPLVSYQNDFAWALRQGRDIDYLRLLNAHYRDSLGPLLAHFRSELDALSALAESAELSRPQPLTERIARARSATDPVAGFAELTKRADRLLAGPGAASAVELDAFERDLAVIIGTVHAMAGSNLELHALLFPQGEGKRQVPERASPTMLRKLQWALAKGTRFLWGFRGIVFFGGYPYPERQSDGYFQRIQIVDSLFTDYWRVYVESTELAGRHRWFDRPAERILVLRVMGGRWRRLLVRSLAVAAALRCRRIYFHSVLRMYDQRFGQLVRLPWLIRAIDVHGVVPEEFRFHNDFYSATLCDREERLAVRHADLAIVVSEAMHAYLRQKYRAELKATVAVFPMFPSVAGDAGPRPYEDGRPTVVYAGGLHRWQQVPKMLDAIARTRTLCRHRFYCPEPEAVRSMLPAELRDEVVVERKTHAEVIELYGECHYGFLLREDVVVNHVACPTKVVEYLAKGLVPIMESENVGDFKALGMQSVSLADFLEGRLPDEATRDTMAQANLAVFERLRVTRDSGARVIHDLFAYRGGLGLRHRARDLAVRLLPLGTRRGNLVRRIARRIRGAVSDAAAEVPEVRMPDLSALPDGCDILMQVDSFEAGGLENVVIDLSRVLERAGYRIVLAVLGRCGEGVERARRQGVRVATLSKSPVAYAALLAHLKPRLALTHYSTYGAAMCADARIPFVQVIHNVYMWLTAAEREELLTSARCTTGFIAVSDYVRRYSIDRLGLDSAACLTIPNGIDTRCYADLPPDARPTKRAELGIDPEDYVFVSVGSINHQKNHLSSVRAFAAVAPEMPDARLVIVGPAYEPSLLEEILAFVENHGLGKRIVYAGAVDTAQPYYAMADAYISAALFEGGPLTLLEALAANLTVITTEVGIAVHFRGMRGIELLETPFDIFSYRGAIWEMQAGSGLTERLAQAMLRSYTDRPRPDLPHTVLASFDKERTYSHYLKLISTLLAGRGWEYVQCRASWPEMVSAERHEIVAS